MDTNNSTKTYIVKKLDQTAASTGLDIDGPWHTYPSRWKEATESDMFRTVGKIFSSDRIVDNCGLIEEGFFEGRWSYHHDDLVEVEPVGDGPVEKGDYVKAGGWHSFGEVIVAIAGRDALVTDIASGCGAWVPTRDLTVSRPDLTVFRPVATDGSTEKIVAVDGAEVHFAPVDGAEKIVALDGTEVRVTSVTGGQKGAKLARYDLMPVDALRELAEHYGKGEKKYPTEAGIPNFRKGYDISLSYAALQRHANQFWGGEDIDAETGSNHMIAAAWHALYIVQTMHDYGDRFDDRLTTSRRKLEED